MPQTPLRWAAKQPRGLCSPYWNPPFQILDPPLHIYTSRNASIVGRGLAMCILCGGSVYEKKVMIATSKHVKL